MQGVSCRTPGAKPAIGCKPAMISYKTVTTSTCLLLLLLLDEKRILFTAINLNTDFRYATDGFHGVDSQYVKAYVMNSKAIVWISDFASGPVLRPGHYPQTRRHPRTGSS